MKNLHTLICFFFLSLQDGNTVGALTVFAGVEGGSVTVKCSFPSSGTRRFFCKGECEEKNVLIQTTGERRSEGRYQIRYKDEDISVTITQLTKSDSGLYMCGLGRSLSSASYKQVEVVVVDARLPENSAAIKRNPLLTRTGRSLTVKCYFNDRGTRKVFCKEQCEQEKDILVQTDVNSAQRGRYSIRYLRGTHGGSLYVTIAQLTESDTGWYTCGLNSSYLGFQIIVSKGLETRGNSAKMEIAFHENQPPESIYQNLHPPTWDQNQIYSTI
ncbi:uncharacterized protein LOC117152797 isoform X2 [Anabas testudineus]|uniref:Immunoglobulin domain-containing protein n=1 Tax=Anabas testudineus TaxID=64144 RepID=A0AAQ6IBQ4_ANATE|nr:uncharacterized protein LOC117152797 isoform X2 [Anabas testudineus]